VAPWTRHTLQRHPETRSATISLFIEFEQGDEDRRATSSMLAVMRAVPQFGRALLGHLDSPAGKSETYTEVRFTGADRGLLSEREGDCFGLPRGGPREARQAAVRGGSRSGAARIPPFDVLGDGVKARPSHRVVRGRVEVSGDRVRPDNHPRHQAVERGGAEAAGPVRSRFTRRIA
jgi:hypothetical protein